MITGRAGNGITGDGIGRIAAAAEAGRLRRQDQQHAQDASTAGGRQASRALVPVGSSASRSEYAPKPVLATNRGSAAFLTQLIASEIGVETMRARRRAAPDIATAAYAASAARPQTYRPQRTLGSL